ncbi:hypothetical protein AJ80_01516 [Polytolypa hystricis UAMH7299]|uniref:D-isomer specific 2-hydroxyacid dehydrogenase NAD-binding domain-containing protein n=1 Tax=Polytolypa hystricis (strain UAMH7299) TaxID=1447883 RepID=A0A2B7Z0Z4_POLH7|nr:hypothetical protein AJ80_01516 [Polytolypa hystricis UAMH7299]
MGDAPPQEHLVVVLPFRELTDIFEDIRDKFPSIRLTFIDPRSTDMSGPEVKDLWASATILSTLWDVPEIEEAPRLKLIQSIAAGVDGMIHRPIVANTDIIVASASGIHGPPIAEWVVMNWLVSSRLYDTTAEWQRNHNWNEDKNSLLDKIEDNVGKRVGILGYGSIGRQIARVSVAMGMKVLAYTFSPRDTPESRRDTGYIVPDTGDPDGTLPISWHSGSDKASLHAFLSQNLDHLLISVPLTTQTTKFIGAEEISILSKSCTRTTRRPYITNIARGKVIDQDALIASLKSRELGGAALDVADPEPLPKDHPLWEAPNLKFSPHVSGLGIEYMGRAFDVLKVNMRRLERGEELINVYRRKKGY